MSQEIEQEVTLQSQDGTEFKVEIKVAQMSETIKNLIEDAGTEHPIPLPNVSASILKKVVEYCKYHVDNPTVVSDEKKDDKRTDNISEWDLEFCASKNLDQPTLFELILAANYLDIKDLLDLTCKTVANMIKGNK